MSYNMFTHVFDVEMKRVFFDERIQYNYKTYFESDFMSRRMAYDSYAMATFDVTIFDRTILYSTCALEYLRHDKKWDKYVKSDKLQQQARSLLKVTPSVREFQKWRMSKYTTDYFY